MSYNLKRTLCYKVKLHEIYVAELKSSNHEEPVIIGNNYFIHFIFLYSKINNKYKFTYE